MNKNIMTDIKKSTTEINKNADRKSADFLTRKKPSGVGLVTDAQQIHIINKKIFIFDHDY